MPAPLPPAPAPDARDLSYGAAFAEGVAFGRALAQATTAAVTATITITRVRPRRTGTATSPEMKGK